MIKYENPKHGIIKESCSKFYPGAKVRIFSLIESVDQYEVASVEHLDNHVFVKAKDVEMEE